MLKTISMKNYLFILILFISFFRIDAQGNRQSVEYLKSNKPTDYVWVVAHRGDWLYAPENSLPALQHAIAFGADVMETDIRLTKDGHFVIMHDLTVDRTTNGRGKVADMTLAEIKKLRLRNNFGGKTDYQVPTLEEFIREAKGKILLYLDKTSYDLPSHEKGTLVRKLLEVLRANNALEETIVVMNWDYDTARRIFGKDLDKIIYCPIIKDNIPDLENYVDRYIKELHPVAFQFRMTTLDSKTYRLLPKVLKSGSKAFVAATWTTHSAKHDDLVSLFVRPSAGWGWLVQQGFRIIESNYPRDFIRYLRSENYRCLSSPCLVM